MCDIYDGDAWTDHWLGMRRVMDENGKVFDEPSPEGSVKPLISTRFGLNMTLNLDW
jgi:hypothetical protein